MSWTYKEGVQYSAVSQTWVDSSGHVEYDISPSMPRHQYLVASEQSIKIQTQNSKAFEIESPNPISIKITDMGEELICSTRRMQEGKPYLTTWEGKRVAVVKTPAALEFYEAVSES